AMRGRRKGGDAELLADAVVVDRLLRALRRVTRRALRLVAVRSQTVTGRGLGADQLAAKLVDLLLQRGCTRLVARRGLVHTGVSGDGSGRKDRNRYCSSHDRHVLHGIPLFCAMNEGRRLYAFVAPMSCRRWRRRR